MKDKELEVEKLELDINTIKKTINDHNTKQNTDQVTDQNSKQNMDQVTDQNAEDNMDQVTVQNAEENMDQVLVQNADQNKDQNDDSNTVQNLDEEIQVEGLHEELTLDEELVESGEELETMEYIVLEENNGVRIDKYLSSIQCDLTRSYIQKLIEEGSIAMNQKTVKANTKVKTGSIITIDIPKLKETEIVPENIPLDIIYEDKDFIIINKQKGLVVHPAAGHTSGTLVNALLYHCRSELSGINGVLRPGIVHRIDRDTTGVMVACKNDKAHQFIADQLKVHSITRRYQALVYHSFKTDGGRVETPIGRDPKDRKKMAVNHKNGKTAATNYKVIENIHNYALIECALETGRTHQIRVHMASINHPLLGDSVYGPGKDSFRLEGQALHAEVIGFIHPTTKEYVEYHAPLPDYFTQLIEKLKNKG